MKITSILLSVLLTASLPLYSNNFPKGIKYLGGPGFADKKEVRNSWDNSLNVTNKEITFSFRKNAIPVETVLVGSVKRITYGQATTRRVGKWVAVGTLVAPMPLLAFCTKADNTESLLNGLITNNEIAAFLMQAHKDQFVGIFNDLAFRTGKPIYADADDRDWLFKTGVKAELDLEAKTDKK